MTDKDNMADKDNLEEQVTLWSFENHESRRTPSPQKGRRSKNSKNKTKSTGTTKSKIVSSSDESYKKEQCTRDQGNTKSSAQMLKPDDTTKMEKGRRNKSVKLVDLKSQGNMGTTKSSNKHERINIIKRKNSSAEIKKNLFTHSLQSLHGNEIIEFAINFANLLDNSLLASIGFIESSDSRSSTIISRSDPDLSKYNLSINAPFLNSHQQWKADDRSYIKKVIEELFRSVIKQNTYFKAHTNGVDESSNEYFEEDLDTYCNVIKNTLVWTCDLALKERYAHQSNLKNIDDLKFCFFSKIIECVGDNLKSSIATTEGVSRYIETNCLTIVGGIIEFATDIESISSSVELKRINDLSIEFLIKKFAENGISEWTSNFKEIVNYSNSLSKKIVRMELLLNEINISAFHSSDMDFEKDQINIITPLGNERYYKQLIIGNNQNAERARSYKITSNKIFAYESGGFIINVNEPSEKLENKAKRIDMESAPIADKHHFDEPENANTIKKIKFRNVYFWIILSLILVFSISHTYHRKLVDDNKKVISVKTLDSNRKHKIEKAVYADPLLGKLLVVFNAYLPAEYDKFLDHLYIKGEDSDNSYERTNIRYKTIGAIANYRKSAVASMQISDMDQIVRDEIRLIQKLSRSRDFKCKSLMPHTDEGLINSHDIINNFDYIVNISMTELESIQSSRGKAENRLYISENDLAEFSNLISSKINDNINSETVSILLLKNSLNKNLNCENLVNILEAILLMPEKSRHKIEQQVLSQ